MKFLIILFDGLSTPKDGQPTNHIRHYKIIQTQTNPNTDCTHTLQLMFSLLFYMIAFADELYVDITRPLTVKQLHLIGAKRQINNTTKQFLIACELLKFLLYSGFWAVKFYLVRVHWNTGTRPRVGEGWDSPGQQPLFLYHSTAC